MFSCIRVRPSAETSTGPRTVSTVAVNSGAPLECETGAKPDQDDAAEDVED
jgi:hypothetical protein